MFGATHGYCVDRLRKVRRIKWYQMINHYLMFCTLDYPLLRSDTEHYHRLAHWLPLVVYPLNDTIPLGGGGRGRRRGGTYRSRRSRSPQWRRHTPRTKDGSTVRHAFCKTFSARYPFLLTLSRADCCRKRLRWTATTPACRRRWTSDVGQSEWLDVGPGRTVSRRITDTGTNGRTRGECLLAADGATGLNRGSGSRIRYIGARSPSSTGRGLRTRRTTRAVPVYGRKQKNDQFQFAGRIEEETR